MAALQLRDVTRTASPFAREVAAAQAWPAIMGTWQPALKVLAADADHGVATVAELRDNFTTIIAPRLAAVAAANREPVAERAWYWVQSLFTTGASAGRRVIATPRLLRWPRAASIRASSTRRCTSYCCWRMSGIGGRGVVEERQPASRRRQAITT